MTDRRKRSASFSAEHWGSKRRKSTAKPQDVLTQLPRSHGAVVALLALTDPTVVCRIMCFVPINTAKPRGEMSRVMGTLVSLCKAVAPFDHALPRHFGPHNEVFWRAMVLRYFDFTTSVSREHRKTESEAARGRPTLALWARLGVSFVPNEYGFLRKLQLDTSDTAPTSWARKEDAFSLFCDLALLVDNVNGIAKLAPENARSPNFVPCLRRAGAIQERAHSSGAVGKRGMPFLSRVRRSKRDRFVQIVKHQLSGWTHFRAEGSVGRCDFYAGQSRLSKRWIGLTSVATSPRPVASET